MRRLPPPLSKPPTRILARNRMSGINLYTESILPPPKSIQDDTKQESRFILSSNTVSPPKEKIQTKQFLIERPPSHDPLALLPTPEQKPLPPRPKRVRAASVLPRIIGPLPPPQFVVPPSPTCQASASLEAEIDILVNQPTFAASQENLNAIEDARQRIEAIIKEIVPEVEEVVLFGSGSSTVMSSNSDLDFCLILRCFDNGDSYIRPTTALSRLQLFFDYCHQEQDLITVDRFVDSARVPVLKCHAMLPIWSPEQIGSAEPNTKVSFDIVASNFLGVQNSRLIRTYTECDERVRLFLLLVKKWAKGWGIADAKEKTLSSYGWNMICLSYLQACTPPIIPNLQSEAYIAASNPDLVVDLDIEGGECRFSRDAQPWKSRAPGLLPNPDDPLQTEDPRPVNTTSLAQLFVNFMEFLSNFYTNEIAFSIKHGALCTTASIKHLLVRQWVLPPFVIVDPLEIGRNVGVSISEDQKVLSAIKQTFAKILDGSHLSSILSNPS
ncbi:putative terminal uridylyltransferase 7 [Blattamonas nauphoetae]|uniref:Terminal uridylyltransferase 7 n=1 Tax=Blattamonas nauphoetae TaxID=2049346 RepID=A0ABQ9YGF5_9EUKA|nr:putative terminal uridylyltransferase 7 [Blattamonas nauphoetae]